MNTGYKVDEERTDAGKQEAEVMGNKVEAETRQTYNPDNNTLDMGNKRATDMASNRRIHLPKARGAKEEVVLNARADVWNKTFERFK